MKDNIIEFLKESNGIEGVYDKDSLQQAICAWEYIEDKKELNVDNVLETHRILMLNQKLESYEKGAFRNVAVFIGGKQGINYMKIPEKLELWLNEMNGANNDMQVKLHKEIKGNLEELNKDLHVEYERIHPFIDGNGRTGRIFTNWWRVKNGLPILVIKESERQDYYKWFK